MKINVFGKYLQARNYITKASVCSIHKHIQFVQHYIHLIVHKLILKLWTILLQQDFETNNNITVDCKDLIECELFTANALQ